VFLDNVQVPVENLVGEPGRGHIIAFNILNLGRVLKLGPVSRWAGLEKCAGAFSIAYAKTAQGVLVWEIAQFGNDPAQAGGKWRSGPMPWSPMAYRVQGLIFWGSSKGFHGTSPRPAKRMMKARGRVSAGRSAPSSKVYASESARLCSG